MKCNKIVLIFFMAVISDSCNKKLDQPVLGLLEESDIMNSKGVEGLLIGAYALLDGYSGDTYGQTGWWGSAASNWIYGSICGGEAYKGSEPWDQEQINSIETFKPSATSDYLASKWQAVYGGVQRANDVLRMMRKAKDIKPADTPLIRAEALFLRAHYHFEAIKMWRNVPFVDESVTYVEGNYRLPNDKLIWLEIENDLKYASDNLPPTQGNAVGRANSYAAKALLAKVYMFQGIAKYGEAQVLLNDLIQNGMTAGGEKYDLVNYADNFNPATKNNAESVFAVQMSVNDGSVNLNTPGNGNAGDVLNFPYGTRPGICCGFFQPSQYLVNHFRTDDKGLPNLDNCNLTDVKNDQGLQSSDPFEPDAGYLDPRLDWTVGRRGIPYLDWGVHPGNNWIRNQINGGPYTPIKNVYYKAQEGLYNDIGFWMKGVVANNVNLIRFADVLLWAAEVEIEIGSLDKAREYVNRVRERAGRQTGWVKNDTGAFAPYAANYNIGLYEEVWTDREHARKAVRYERMLELAMEGQRFFDLVRWGIADIEMNCYFEKEKQNRSYMADAKFEKNCDEYFPIPQPQIDLSAGADGIPKMKQNPCH